MTAVHSASASLLAKRQGKEDTVRLLRSQVRGLLQKIDMDSMMMKMAEQQLTVVRNPKNRKAIENQVRSRGERERGWRPPPHPVSTATNYGSGTALPVNLREGVCSADASCGLIFLILICSPHGCQPTT